MDIFYIVQVKWMCGLRWEKHNKSKKKISDEKVSIGENGVY